jgi:16S rRNA (uracil1498-N3)-methyltransferase
LREAIRDAARTFYLSTSPDAVPLSSMLPEHRSDLTLLIGPEGGWTDAETQWFESSAIRGVKLTPTILRVETAAIAAAAVAMSSAPLLREVEVRPRRDTKDHEE